MNEETALSVPEESQIIPVPQRTPEEIVSEATHQANVLKPIIEQKKLYKNISGKDHVMAEGWAALLGLMNVDPVPAWSKRVEREDGEYIYEARLELFKNGNLIGAGEALASSEEGASWARTEQGIKSMALTRALGKACRLKYSWIMVMAGYEPTAAEEFSESKSRTNTTTVATPEVERVTTAQEYLSEKQRALFWAQIKKFNLGENVMRQIVRHVRGQESTSGMSVEEMKAILKKAEEFAASGKRP